MDKDCDHKCFDNSINKLLMNADYSSLYQSIIAKYCNDFKKLTPINENHAKVFLEMMKTKTDKIKPITEKYESEIINDIEIHIEI